MKLSPTNELIIACVAIAALAVAFIGLLIVPQYFAMGEKDQQSQQAIRDIQTAQNLLNQRQSVKSQAAGTQAGLMNLQNQIPDSPELPSLIIELQNIANASGMEFTKITPADPAPMSGYTALPIEVVLQGSWSDVIDYLHRLQRLERQIRTTGVIITSDVPTLGTTTSGSSGPVTPGSSGVLQATIKIEAYTIGAAPSKASSTTAGSGAASAPATATP